MVGEFDDIEVVLDDNDGVALIDKAVEDDHEGADVLKMQSCGGFVEDVERLARVFLRQFGGKFHALAFAAGEGRGGLTEFDVAQSDLLQHLDFLQYFGLVLEELHGLVDGHA